MKAYSGNGLLSPKTKQNSHNTSPEDYTQLKCQCHPTLLEIPFKIQFAGGLGWFKLVLQSNQSAASLGCIQLFFFVLFFSQQGNLL